MLVGQKIGPFIVDKELGSGAMGAVYRGRHGDTGKKVAIKVIAPGLVSNDMAFKRFEREINILKQLDHPNIVKVLAKGKVHGTPFYVMEHIEGESLDHVMERRGRLTWEEVVVLGQQLCSALEHAHLKGIVHRDLKPSNLMILKDGTVKLTDFGIAKDIDVTALTAANSTVGTASYMSPEQCRGSRDITNKSDLYSMGVMFFELITGRKPFLAETVMEMFMQHTQGTFPRPSRLVLDMPIWLDNLICHLLEKEPDKRPFSAAKVAESLAEVKEQWEKQQSAGLTRAKKRRSDRSGTETALDETDKEVARTLLGKKKKKKEEPFYTKNWFTVTAVSLVLLALGTVFYIAFIKPPSAESLFVQAEKLMLSKDFEDHREARRGPLQEFLDYHPEHAKAHQIRSWADQFDREMCELQMYNRRQNFAAQGEVEPVARMALVAEEGGKLEEAKKHWEELAKYQESKDPNLRPWGLMAEKFLNEYKAVDVLFRETRTKTLSEETLGKKARGDSPLEEMALSAIRFENQKKWPAATLEWEDLKKNARDQQERLWLLLAGKRLRDLATMDKKNP